MEDLDVIEEEEEREYVPARSVELEACGRKIEMISGRCHENMITIKVDGKHVCTIDTEFGVPRLMFSTGPCPVGDTLFVRSIRYELGEVWKPPKGASFVDYLHVTLDSGKA